MELNWAPSTAAAVLDPVFKRWAERKAGRQRRVDAFFDSYHSNKKNDTHASKRLRRALDETEPEAPKQKKKRKRRVVVESEEEEEEDDESARRRRDRGPRARRRRGARSSPRGGGWSRGAPAAFVGEGALMRTSSLHDAARPKAARARSPP